MGCGGSKSMEMVTPPVMISVESLQQYLELEKDIQLFEKKHVLENYQIKTEQLDQLDQAIQQLEEEKRVLESRGIIGRKDLLVESGEQTVKEFLLDQAQFDGILTKEQEQHLETLNRQEIIEREMESLVQQRNILRNEVEELVQEGERLEQLYKRRDELLDGIFGSQYGSDFEIQIEKELDWLQEQKHHVDQAHFRWKQAHLLVKQSVSHFGSAVQKWKEIAKLSPDEVEQRYYYAAETRDSLIAGSQSIQGAQRYLPTINFPYSSTDEMETLDKAIAYCFTDMQSQDRYEHALQVYLTTFRRAGALKQWLEQVLNTTIARDLAELNEECKAKKAELRSERIRLIRRRVKEITGRNIDYDLEDSLAEEEEAHADAQIARLFETDRHERRLVNHHRPILFTARPTPLHYGANSLTPDPRSSTTSFLPTPLPMADLAPLPSNEEIFGQIEELHNRHRRQLAEYQKAQAFNQARMVQGLKEKLQERRNRRTRSQMHSREMEVLQEIP